MNTAEFKHRFMPLSRKLYAVARRITGNGQDAEDIVQEAYMKLWDRRNDMDHVVNVEAYCVTLVKRLCYDAVHERLPDDDAGGDVACDADDAGMRDDAMHVRQMIDRLPEQQRMVITMRDVDDCSYEDIEKKTGMSAVNVRVMLSRARKKIREQFKELLDNEKR